MAVVTSPAELKTLTQVAGSEPQKKRDPTKWLHKTKLCVYSLQGTCRLGDKCSYAHSVTDLHETPNLSKTQLCTAFMEGCCDDELCPFAHGAEELRLSPNYKNKLCKWYGKGRCRNGDECGFAHGMEELRAEPPAERSAAQLRNPCGGKAMKPPPGLSLDVDDAKRDAPLVLDLEGNLLDEKIPVPLEQQVGEMSSKILAMQTKMDDMWLRSQVSGMRQVLEQLSVQCAELDATLKQTTPDIGEPMPKTPSKTPLQTPLKISLRTRLSASAMPFKPMSSGVEAHPSPSTYEPFAPGSDWPSDDSTSIGSGGFSSD